MSRLSPSALALALAAAAWLMPTAAGAAPEAVQFASSDGTTTLTGYVFKTSEPGRRPAIVMLHGRSGAYSSLKRGSYDAQSLSARHVMWGELWAKRGYVALLVDSFGPRGYPAGFPAHSYRNRPPEVSEERVRPLDAYGALEYLKRRDDIDPARIALQGWSNGAMTVLATMDAQTPARRETGAAHGFRAALALYPSCRTQEKQPRYAPYAPLLILSGSDDDEVSPQVCRRFAEAARARGAPIEFVLYEGAQHAFDEPGATKQRHEPNRAAAVDSRLRAESFFKQHLEP